MDLPTAELELLTRDFLVTKYVSVAGLAILLYDHLLTLDDEVQFIWKEKWNIPKYMFLFLRYIVPLMVILTVLQTVGFAVPNLGHTSSCKGIMTASILAGFLAMAFSHVFAMVRLWFLCDYESWLVRGTLGCFVLTEMVTVACVSVALRDILSTTFWNPQLKHCSFSHRLELGKIWAPGVFFDVIASLVVAANVLSRPREASKGLLKCLLNDGYFYFFMLLLFRITNLVIALTARPSLLFVGIFLIWCAVTAITTRFVLRLRRQVVPPPSLAEDTGFELKPSSGDHNPRTEIRVAATTSIDSAIHSMM